MYDWPPLESDPEIFTDYMASVGLPANWSFSELYGIADEEMLNWIPQPRIAVILNAQYKVKRSERPQGSLDTQCSYYMKQTAELDNACGVVACLHAIYNNVSADKITLDPESVLGKFFGSIRDASPADRATALEGYD